ncbi:MAG: type II toxin-antitoxin system HicA family toxin [Lachnospiraceae bacterium]|nr:type II toxin-antitoxin system HicA family toxin [Lachnospiraceae bacterium]
MAEYEKKVREILLQNGCRFLRHGKGDHDIWINPDTGFQSTVDGKIKSRYTANAVMKQLGIDYRF